jgi:ribosomal protein L11 methyltransferase
LSSDYWSLDVRLDPEATDAVANFLAEAGATGVVEEADGGAAAPVRLRAFFPPGTDPAGTDRDLRRYLDDLRALAVPVGPGTTLTTQVAEEAWADAWRAYFRPVRVGSRLLVCPPWDVPGDPDRLVVVIEPGRAFGTGGHGSTRACLTLVERALAAPVAHVLDVGTGSGILAIAAARLGAPAVTALDPDPDAVAAARANAVRNGVSGQVRAECAGIQDWAGPPAPLVLANLLGAALIALAPRLACATTGAGTLVAGGLLVHEVPAVAAAFVPHGFELTELVEDEGWAGLRLTRQDAALRRPA